ncbi:MAG: thiol-disulfide oxidoreductase DCC family protein [Roseococcus sp.]
MTDPPACTVYYDGACPVCAREIALYRQSAGAERLAFVDVSAAGDPAPDLPRAAALARMHVRRADGTLASGAAAFAVLWQALPGWRLLGRIAALPGVAQALELAYRAFLRARRIWRRG